MFYQIFVRSWNDAIDGNLANDGIGDFRGLIDRLDYLAPLPGDAAAAQQSLGINAIWLMPIMPSPSYHGYDVTDYFDVHPEFGDLALFREFLAAAHRRGIRVIIDLVLNHASSQHPWFVEACADEESPRRDYFVFAKERLHAAGPWGEPAWHYREGEYYYGVFWSGMPDWNFNHAGVTEHHKRVARFWLQEVGVDGFRLDAVRYLYEDGPVLQDLPQTRRWLHDFRAYCESIRPDVFIIGEVWADTGTVSQYVLEDSLHAAFEFDLSAALIESVKFGSATILSDRLQRIRAALGERPWAVFLTNHDQERIMSQLEGDPAKMRLAASLLLLNGGFPFIYYGEEIGMTGRKPDPYLRTPMQWESAAFVGFSRAEPWHAVHADFPQVNVASQLAQPDSLLQHYRRLIRLRQESPSLRRGQPVALTAEGRIFAEARRLGDETVLILANFRQLPSRRWSVSLPELPAAAEIDELLHGATVRAPADGNFNNWQPLEVLEPQSAYLIRIRHQQ